MMRYSIVDEAVSLVSNILEANRAVCDNDSIFNKVYDWYSHSDVADPEILAACVLTGKNWSPRTTYQDMLDAKNYWFPYNPYDEVSIVEIQMVRFDM